jgi:hypothetical protein
MGFLSNPDCRLNFIMKTSRELPKSWKIEDLNQNVGRQWKFRTFWMRVVNSRVKSFGKCRSHSQKSELRSENDFKSIVGTRLKDWRHRDGFGAWSYSTSKVKICNLQLEIPKSMLFFCRKRTWPNEKSGLLFFRWRPDPVNKTFNDWQIRTNFDLGSCLPRNNDDNAEEIPKWKINPSFATCSAVAPADRWLSQPLWGGSHLLRGLGTCLTGEKGQPSYPTASATAWRPRPLPDGLGHCLPANFDFGSCQPQKYFDDADAE